MTAVWLAGCALLAVLTLLPATRKRIRGLWPLMISEAAILAVGTLPWFLPHGWLALVLVGGALRFGYESGAVNGGPVRPAARHAGAMMLAGVTILAWFAGPPTSLLPALIWLAVATAGHFAALFAPGGTWLRRFTIFPALPYVCFVLAALWLDMAHVFVLSLLIVEIFDSFAVLGGRLFGRHLMVPRLSPRKTWEGFAVGLAAAMLAGAGLSLVLDLPATTIIAIAAASTVGAVVGDLTASAAKRHAGVKDYPPVLKIQGGLLDIYDAWIVAAPAAVAVTLLINQFR